MGETLQFQINGVWRDASEAIEVKVEHNRRIGDRRCGYDRRKGDRREFVAEFIRDDRHPLM